MTVRTVTLDARFRRSLARGMTVLPCHSPRERCAFEQ